MRRELGLPTRLKHSVLDPPTILPEGVNLKESIQQPHCLVSLELYKWEQEILEVKKKELHSFEKAPRIDFKSCRHELAKCYKKAMGGPETSNSRFPCTRKQIIVGIELRCQQVFPNDPDYVERLTKELDEMLDEKISSLYRSIWFTENL